MKRKKGLVKAPAFITVFDGQTGAKRETILFWPPIGPESEMRETWGDDWGHRSNSIKGAVLYHKEHGSLVVFSRGIYTRVAMLAHAFRGGKLESVWTFDSDDPSGKYLGYRAMGNHSVAVGDIDGEGGRLLTAWHFGASTLHATKNDANLVADILGDWREEVILRRSDNRALLVFSTWLPTARKNYTFMHDPVYRMNVAVQNVGYNQPAHVGYYFADGMPRPNIRLIRCANTANGDAK